MCRISSNRVVSTTEEKDEELQQEQQQEEGQLGVLQEEDDQGHREKRIHACTAVRLAQEIKRTSSIP
jgi:hypothetical protein